MDALRLARQHARPVVRRHRAPADLGVGWPGSRSAVLAPDCPPRGGIAEDDQIYLSNAPADTSVLRLAQMQGQRYWVERTEDAKGECGLADYQVLGWRAWHHHVTTVMLAMLFIAEQRAAHQPSLEFLTPRDIVEMLKETLPRKPEGREALLERINQRHQRRRGAIESRFPHSAKDGASLEQDSCQLMRLCQTGATGLHLRLLLNFGKPRLGIKRIILCL
jgi:hypothetical protein